MIETGTTLQQRYKIDKQIGQGGMGAVYVATDARFGSTVAIKETLCMDENFRKAIEREARLLNSLKHAALPRVSDHFEENNGMFLVMEYISGQDVAAMLENPNVKFSVDQVLRWADQLLDALDYLHTQDMPVIHRDIKPQNLKVNSRGEMILLDFGLAKGNPTDAGHQTAAKSIFGYSRNYASLEQIQGTGTDPRSDIYSLAATLYHMLTGVAPEDALTRAMSVLSNSPDPLAPASTVNPEVPRGVAGVLQKAMDLNASQRPATAAEMRNMLREHEQFAYLADAATFAGNVNQQRVFAQPTRLMPEGTTPGLPATNARTEVLPGNLSQLTAVRSTDLESQTVVHPSSPSYAPQAKGRGLSVAAGALVMLVVCVAALGGAYMMKPSLFSGGEREQPTANPVTAPEPAPVTADASVANTAPAGTSAAQPSEPSTEVGSAKPSTESPKAQEPARQPETAKAETKATGSGSRTIKDPDEDIEVTFDSPDMDINKGGMTVRERDENGDIRTIRINPPKAPNMRQQRPGTSVQTFPNIDMSHMTPMQRQKLLRVLKNNPAMRPVPPNAANRPQPE